MILGNKKNFFNVLGIQGRGISKYAKIASSSQGALYSENPEDFTEVHRVLDDSSKWLRLPRFGSYLHTCSMMLDMSFHQDFFVPSVKWRQYMQLSHLNATI